MTSTCLSCHKPSTVNVCAACATVGTAYRISDGVTAFRAVRVALLASPAWAIPALNPTGPALALAAFVQCAGIAIGAGHYAVRDQTGIDPKRVNLGDPCEAFISPTLGKCHGIGYAVNGRTLIDMGQFRLCPPCAVAAGINASSLAVGAA